MEGGQLDLFLTCVARSVTAWSKVDTLWAGAGVTTRSEETQVAAGSLTRVLVCKHMTIALLKAKVAKEDLAFECELGVKGLKLGVGVPE